MWGWHTDAWAALYGSPGLPKLQDSPLGFVDDIQRSTKYYIWHRFSCRSCQKGDSSCHQTAFGASLRIYCRGLLP